MIPSVQITGAPDLHPEHPVHDAHDLASGGVNISSLDMKNHNTKVFDMMDAEERDRYDELYLELSRKSKQGKILIISNARETLSRSDGSTGWFKYLEWAEFDTSGILGA